MFLELRQTAYGVVAGGSVSMPAAYCGVFSLKPSYQRFPWNGIPTNVSNPVLKQQ